MALETEPLPLIEAFTRVAKILGKLPDDDTRRRVLAAVICLIDDKAANAALWSWKQRAVEEGAG